MGKHLGSQLATINDTLMKHGEEEEVGGGFVSKPTGGNINCSWQVVVTSWRLFGMVMGCVCVCDCVSELWLINHSALTQLKRGS